MLNLKFTEVIKSKLSTTKKSSLMPLLLAVMVSPVAALANSPSTSVADSAEVKLALGIVHKYRELRADCRSLPDEQKSMCFYRLKIGNWDYREAKLILAKHKLI